MYDRYLDTFLDDFCVPHGELIPCKQCETVRRIRELNKRLEHEHAALPIRRPKVLEQK